MFRRILPLLAGLAGVMVLSFLKLRAELKIHDRSKCPPKPDSPPAGFMISVENGAPPACQVCVWAHEGNLFVEFLAIGHHRFDHLAIEVGTDKGFLENGEFPTEHTIDKKGSTSGIFEIPLSNLGDMDGGDAIFVKMLICGTYRTSKKFKMGGAYGYQLASTQ